MRATRRDGRCPRARATAFDPGLRWRLTAWVAGVMVVSAAVVFVVVYQDTGVQLRSQIDRDITRRHDPAPPVAAPFARRARSALAAAATNYMRAQPYSATSTAAVRARARTAQHGQQPPRAVRRRSSRRGRERGRAADRERARAASLLMPHLGFSTARVPDVGQDADLRASRAYLGNGDGRRRRGGAAGGRRARTARGRSGVRARRRGRARCWR